MPSKVKRKPNCWKVLNGDPARNSHFAIGELLKHYPIGEPVRAEVGGLLAFSTKKAAKAYADGYSIIVPAVGKTKLSLPLYRDGVAANISRAEIVWAGGVSDLVGAWPQGTVAYKEITCLE